MHGVQRRVVEKALLALGKTLMPCRLLCYYASLHTRRLQGLHFMLVYEKCSRLVLPPSPKLYPSLPRSNHNLIKVEKK